MSLLQKIRGFLKLGMYKSDLERGIPMDKSNENESIETKIEEYCRKYNISRENAEKELYKSIKETAKKAGYRLRVNNGGFIHSS